MLIVMQDSADYVTVYRSMDADAEENCEAIIELLSDEGLKTVMLDDSSPGVPEGTFEVQVPAADAARAEQLIAENPLADEVEEVDDSSNLDLETIYHADGTLAEVESLGIRNVLEANGITAVLVGNSVLPTMSFEVRVAREQVERARELIAEAQIAGPAAAEEAELETEGGAAFGA
jgi:hypothetical protein